MLFETQNDIANWILEKSNICNVIINLVLYYNNNENVLQLIKNIEEIKNVDYNTARKRFNILTKFLSENHKIFIITCLASFTTRSLCNFNNYTENTNKDFPNFRQAIYHAGNVEQFYKYSMIDTINDKTIIETKWSHFPIVYNYITIDKTFAYLFYMMKKGIFVYIKDNSIKVFLPFSNANYKNDFNHKLIKTDDINILNNEQNNIRRKSKGKLNLIRDPSKWYANYCMFRNESFRGLLDEGDKSTMNFLNLLTDMVASVVVPDICFFINPRDHPVVKKDQTPAYEILYNTEQRSKKVNTFNKGWIPIFSQSVTDEFADLLFPNDDDILATTTAQNDRYTTDWSLKKNIAFFRGSATGCGVRSNSNPRLAMVAKANALKAKDPFYTTTLKLDIGITSYNQRLKVDPTTGVAEYINVNDYKLSGKVSPDEQSKCKYIINIEGHVAAFRLAREFSYKSCVILINSPWKLWYSDLIKTFDPINSTNPNQSNQSKCHCITTSIENLDSTLKWCHNNENICRIIAENGYKLWDTKLKHRKFMYDYLNYIFERISPFNSRKS